MYRETLLSFLSVRERGRGKREGGDRDINTIEMTDILVMFLPWLYTHTHTHRTMAMVT